jgi:very-short-patch-repair endonuclease
MKRLSLAPNAIGRARNLRKSATLAEQIVRRALKENFPEAHFRFQVPFGPYIADFASHRAKLIIEIDGDSHGFKQEYDATRTAFLNSQGYRVIRFWNNDILSNLEGVVANIREALPPCGEGLGWGPDASASEKEILSTLPVDAPTPTLPTRGRAL